MLLLYRDARSTDSDFNHVKVILDTVPLDWNTMHNTYGVPANASGDTTVTFVSYDSGTTGYRRCYFDSNHNVHSSYMPSNTVYFDESDGTFYIFPTGTTRKRTNPYVPFLNTAGEQIELHEFTYAAKRMDKAPTLTATFYDYECYDKKWNTNNNDQKKVQRYYNIFTILNGERYYLKNTPTSVFEDKDARYKHSLVFLSERDILEHTIMFDSVHTTYPIFDTNTSYAQNAIVQYGALYYQFLVAHSAGPWDITQVTQLTGVTSPVSESAEFSFYGTAIDLANRINGVLVQSGITTYDQTSDTYDGYHVVFDYYQQFSTTTNYSVDDIVIYNNKYYIFTQKHNAGAWNSNHVNEYTLPGLAISFDKETIYDALQKFNTDFELMYYFDGQTIYVKEYQNLVSTTIEQGVEDALLSIEKQNKNSELVSRMTAIGSEDNIPYYYPNPTEDGFLKPVSALSEFNFPYRLSSDDVINFSVSRNQDVDKFYLLRLVNYFVYGKFFCGFTQNDALNFEWAGNHSYVEITGTIDTRNVGETVIVPQAAVPFGNFIDEINDVDWMFDSSHETWSNYILNGAHQLLPAGLYTAKQKIYVNSVNPPYRRTGDYFGYKTTSRQYSYNGSTRTVPSTFIDRHPSNVLIARWNETSTGGLIHNHFCTKGNIPYGSTSNPSGAVGSLFYNDGFVYEVGQYQSGTKFAKVDITYSKLWNYGCTIISCMTQYEGSVYFDELTGNRWRCSNAVSNGRQIIPFSGSNLDPDYYSASDYVNIVGFKGAKVYTKEWTTEKGESVEISSYGLSVLGSIEILQTIKLLREKYLQPQSHLMPELYQKTDGTRRFYDAIQYPIRDNVQQHHLDTDAGEYVTSDGANIIVSNHYYEDSGGNYMVIENPYEQGNKREFIGEYDDIKPTIEGAKIIYNGQTIAIDIIEKFEYDLLDNDDLMEVDGNQNDELSYQHPYFYAKLRPLGFNIFDMAIDESEMIINFNTGSCGSCKFKVMVGSKYKQNTVRIWPYNAYTKNGSTYTEKYHQGDLMRYDEDDLYKLVDGNYVLITDMGLKNISTTQELSLDGVVIIGTTTTQRSFRTWGDVICTDVKLSSVEDSQKDTSSNYVWICLMKDISTFGTIMPSKVHLLTPAASKYDDESGVEHTRADSECDKFVFTHIRMPQTYVRNAEIKLTKQIIKDLVLMNIEQWAFSIKFSRIYYAENTSIAALINENTLFDDVVYDGVSYKLSVESFTYKIQNKDTLPEITVQIEDLKSKIKYRKKLGGIVIPGGNGWIVPVRPVVNNEIVRRYNDDIRVFESRFNALFNSSTTNFDAIALLNKIKGNEGAITNINDFSKILDTNQGYPEFDVSTVYEKDAVVRKDGLLYRFTAKHNAGTSWDLSSKTQTNIGSEDGISRDAANAADLKASNILTDLGFQLFDSTRSYSENEIVVYNNRLYRFTTPKSVGNWDVSKVALDSVANCVFRSLGLEEYNSSRTQTIRRGTSFFKNGKAFIATQDFVPSQVGEDVSRVTNSYNIVSMMATESDTKALSQTVEVLRQTVSSLNSQILDKDNGLATIVRGVNSRLATLTYDMATLADSLKANEHLSQDASVTSAAVAVVNSANAATAELTGADDSSVYNKMADIYSKDVFGERVSVVRSQFTTEDAEFKFTKMIYDSSHYMTTQDATFVEFSTEESYNEKDRVIHNKHLYEFTSPHEKGEWNPLEVTNIDDILLKAVFFATDRYNEDAEDIFLTKGRFIDTNALCDYVYETVIKSGEAGIIYTELKDIMEAASKNYEEIYDGSDKNMITDHVWAVGGYTVLQFASLRLEYNDRIYVAAIYKDDYTRDDNRHILFDIKYINSMSEKLQTFFIESDKVVEYDGKTYYYVPRVDIAKNIGDNYLYCADAQVDDGKMLFVEELTPVGEQNCYLLPKE